MFASSLRRRGAVILLAGLIGGGFAIAQSTTRSTSEPTNNTVVTPPKADKGGDETITVAKGSIDLRLDLDGVFAPLDPLEIAAKTKA